MPKQTTKTTIKAPKRKIRRRRRGKNSVKLYFTKDTQCAILEFTKTEPDDVEGREKIYRTRIAPAFEKLVENLINIYGFRSTDPYDELKADCVTFLFETMKKFDHTRGTNAFSYFNVVAKNWLIIRSKARVKKLKSTVSTAKISALSRDDRDAIAKHQVIEAQDITLEYREGILAIAAGLEEIRRRLKNENEMRCIDSIITIFKHVDQLDLLNKSAILLYIKEISGLSQKQLTTSLHTIKKHYKEIKKSDLELF